MPTLRNEIRRILDSNQELQTLINSPAWAQDTVGQLVRQAMTIGLAAGATEGEMYDYLEMTDDEN